MNDPLALCSYSIIFLKSTLIVFRKVWKHLAMYRECQNATADLLMFFFHITIRFLRQNSPHFIKDLVLRN